MPAKKRTTSHLPGTFEQAWDYYSDQDRCVEYIARLRWPDGPTCPQCGSKSYSYLKTRRMWKCAACRKQYSVRVGTIFEDSPIPLRKWLMAIWEVANDRNGISSHELARKLGVTQKTGWFMLHRIRLAMQNNSFEKFSEKFDGAVEVDETFIGGRARSMNASRRRRWEAEAEGQGPFRGKTGVLGFKQRSGEIAVTVIHDREADSLQREVRKHVKPQASVITDELSAYKGLDQHYQHKVVNHAERYVDGQVHVNGLENFWSLFKRGLGGTYVSVRPFHLFRYLDESVYRFNTRRVTEAERVDGVLGRIGGRRITYKDLTGKHREPAPPPKPEPRKWPNYPMGPF